MISFGERQGEKQLSTHVFILPFAPSSFNFSLTFDFETTFSVPINFHRIVSTLSRPAAVATAGGATTPTLPSSVSTQASPPRWW